MILLYLAYWIAFGPHGPRAQPPKGEGFKIFLKVTQLCIASVLVFYAIHYFAKPMPKTMSKEWQEASNEYAKVSVTQGGIYMAEGFPSSRGLLSIGCSHLCLYSPRRSTPSTASAPSTTRARASCRALPPRSHRWIVAPIGDEQSADIGRGRGWGLSFSHAHEDPEAPFSGHALAYVRHVFSTAAGPFATELSCSPFLSFWPSIRKCVYPVLCYNQCISFVAIENTLFCIFSSDKLRSDLVAGGPCPFVRVLPIAW